MFLKLLVEGLELSANFPVIEIRDEALIFDLKRNLESVLQIPIPQLNIKYNGQMLPDHHLLCRVFERCQERDDLLTYNGDLLVCRVRFVENIGNGDRRKSIAMNMDVARKAYMDQKCSGLTNDMFCSSTGSCSSGQSESQCTMTNISLNASSCPSSGDEQCHQQNRSERCCPVDPNRPIYAAVMPEDRQFGLVLERAEGEECVDFACVLEFLSKRLLKSGEARTHHFSVCVPLGPLDDALLIVCGDSNTRDWLLQVSRSMYPAITCVSFIRYFELVRWCVTLPMPVGSSLCSAFKILENQNPSLDTSKWTVTSQSALDPCTKEEGAYPGVELRVFIDKKSVELLAQTCNQLKYIVWKPKFHPCAGIC